MAQRDKDLAYDFSVALQSLRDRHRGRVSGKNATQLTMAALIVDGMTGGRANSRWSYQDILDTLVLIRGIRVLLDVCEGDVLARGKRRGISFQRLATALGLKSRQAAEQRLIKLELGRNDAEDGAWSSVAALG